MELASCHTYVKSKVSTIVFIEHTPCCSTSGSFTTSHLHSGIARLTWSTLWLLTFAHSSAACQENYEWRGRSCEPTIHTTTTTTTTSSHVKDSRTLHVCLLLLLALLCSILVYYTLLRTRTTDFTDSSNDERYLSRVQFLS